MKQLTLKTTLFNLLIAAAGLLPFAPDAGAQHYPAGAEGIKTATLPPEGAYLRDYNFLYFADRFPDGPPRFDAFAYVNAPRLIWMTDWDFLGADYGMDVIVPFGYKELKAAGARDDRFGLGDMQVEPLLLSWHTKRFDIAAAYAIWAPTGDFDKDHLANLGSGFWTHMFTAGATWYVNEEKTWAVGLLNRYEINHEQRDTDITPGQTLTMEWGLSKSVCKGVDLGVIGYWQQQVTQNSGPGTSDALAHVVGVGPEILTFCPKLGLFASARYVHEFAAKDRPEGDLAVVTLTKRF